MVNTMVNRTTVVRDDGKPSFMLSSLTPGRAQKRVAVGVALALMIIFLITAGPLSTIQLAPMPAIVAAYGTAMCVVDLITAVLLFGQFSILRAPGLLVIAVGYLFTSLVAIPWMLVFPGTFAPNGLLGGGLQSAPWLYVLWHVGFPVAVIGCALLKGDDPAARLWQGSTSVAILCSAAATVAVVGVATFLFTWGDALLPLIMIDAVRIAPLWTYVSMGLVLCYLPALMILWLRRSSALDLWLMVVMCAQVIEICLIAFFSTRFSIGWYVGRACGLLSGSLVLVVLLYETTRLYAQMSGVLLVQRREREARLVIADTMTATIAHEVKQPLSGIVTNADAGLRWVERSVPDLDEAKAAFKRIVADGRRAAAVIESVRAMVKTGDLNRSELNVNGLIAETLALVRADVQKNRIVVQTELDRELPLVVGDPIQLQQVLLNLITNAIDAMAAIEKARILCVKSNVYVDGGVKVSVADTGAGIGWHDINQIFADPLFTRKIDGTEMGLSICRSIIEAHHGRIWVAPNKPQGAVFQFVLLAGAAASAAAPQE